MMKLSSKKCDIIKNYSQMWLWIIMFGFIISLAMLSYLHYDEREHAYAALLISQGEIPYKDFFEHHHPLLWYIASPVLLFMRDNANVWYILRIFEALISFITCVYIYKLTVLSTTKKTAAYGAVLIYYCFEIVKVYGIQFRPDNLMICLFLVGLYHLCQYLRQERRKDLYISFGLFFMSFLVLQKAPILFGFPCLYVLIKGLKNKKFLTDVVYAIIPYAIVFLMLLLFVWQKIGIKDYYELNWIFNFLANQNVNGVFMPLYGVQKYTLYVMFALALYFLIGAKSIVIRLIAGAYILYGCVTYTWHVRYIHYMLPFYPLIAIFLGYTLSLVFNKKKHWLEVIVVISAIMFTKYAYDEIQHLHHSRKKMPIYVMYDQMMLNDTAPSDQIIYITTWKKEHYFGGLKRQALDYYWFSIGGAVVLDYMKYYRHPYPILREIVKQRRPKIVVNGNWDDCSIYSKVCGRNQTLDMEYMQQHYINKGIYYLRID